MTSNLVKCRVCLQIFEDTVTFCPNPNCGSPDFERTEDVPTPAPGASDASGPFEKICPRCKARNEAYAVICECSHEFTSSDNILPTQVAAVPSIPDPQVRARKAQPKLWLVVGTQAIECHHGDTIGREGTLACDLFKPIGTVSRKHIAVELRGEQWYLVNLPLAPDRHADKMTEVDGTSLKAGESIALSGEHIARMSSRCDVRLRVEAAERGF